MYGVEIYATVRQLVLLQATLGVCTRSVGTAFRRRIPDLSGLVFWHVCYYGAPKNTPGGGEGVLVP
jgi:hypothetical protein